MKKKKTKWRSPLYYRMGKFPIQYVIDNIIVPPKDCRKGTAQKRYSDTIINGVHVYMNSLRYHLFKHKGTRCVSCGIIGQYFRLEKSRYDDYKEDRFHFNLYAIDEQCNEVLMTKDHIVPKSKGGKNHLTNLQPMCTRCNHKKDSQIWTHGIWSPRKERENA